MKGKFLSILLGGLTEQDVPPFVPEKSLFFSIKPLKMGKIDHDKLNEDPFHIDWSNTDFNDHEVVKAILHHLANLVEALHRENLALKAEIRD